MIPHLAAGPPPPSLIGTANLLRLAYTGQDLLPLHHGLVEILRQQPTDSATLMNLCVLEQLLGDRASGMRRQGEALARQTIYRSCWPASPAALRVLAFAAPGDIGTNTPIDFLLQGGDIVLITMYILPERPLPQELPQHDIAIVTIGESDRSDGILQALAAACESWPTRVLNHPLRILDLSRENLHRRLAGLPGVAIPRTTRISRADLAALANGQAEINRIFQDDSYPVIVRPIDSHAGRGLARIRHSMDFKAYLETAADNEFTLSPYMDYASRDGSFRKYRIVWVEGVPFPCHMAICDDWKVWYLNADMIENPAHRAEEAAFMCGFESDFGRRHSTALTAIAKQLDLHYFGIDCAETPDGHLLVFEADVSLIVHDLDPPAMFPYKQPCMHALFAAFQASLQRQAVPISP